MGKEEKEDTGCQLYIYRKIIPGFKQICTYKYEQT